MPFEHVLPETIGPLAERRAAGRELRKAVPRRAHAVWKASPSRHDPVQRLIESNRHLISSLVPVRYGRMQLSVASFFRGAACIMAADLAETPCSGLWAQASGDCHLRNFGIVASDDAAPIFDLNDFDETLRAPFEWDVKRLAASFAVEARARRLGDKTARSIARTAVMSYRLQMEKLSQLDPLASWHVQDRRLRRPGQHRGHAPAKPAGTTNCRDCRSRPQRLPPDHREAARFVADPGTSHDP